MKNKYVYISFAFLVFAIIFSYFKQNHCLQKNYNNRSNYSEIIRYGENVKVGEIININNNKEIVIKVFKDGSYITKKLECIDK